MHTKKGREIFNAIKDDFSYVEIAPEAAVAGAKEMKESVAPNEKRESFFKDANRMSGEELFNKYFPETFKVKAEHCIRLTCYKLGIYSVAKKLYGSPDQCGEICDEYAEKDKRIRVLHKKNGGLSSARNYGCKAAQGKWIMFVDGDDWIEPDMCQTMYSAGEEKQVQLVMCGIMKDYGKSATEYKFYLDDGKVYKGQECKWLQQQLLVYNGNIAVAYSKLIDRKLLINNQIFHDEVLRQGAEGLEFNLRLFEKLESAIFINKPFYHYIYNENSISASHNEANHEFVIRCFEKIKEFIDTSDNKEMLKPWFDNRLLYVIVTTAISGYFNPTNTESYEDKKRKYAVYLEKPIVKEALKTKNTVGIGKQRKIVLFFIKHRMYWIVNMMGKMRKWQKEHR